MGDLITMNVTDQRFDIGIKGQGQIYREYVLSHITHSGIFGNGVSCYVE